MSLGLCIDSFLHYLVLEPRPHQENGSGTHRVAVTSELHDLVKQKMIEQDARLRTKLGSIKWSFRDKSTIQVLFGNQPLEEVRTLDIAFRLHQARSLRDFIVDSALLLRFDGIYYRHAPRRYFRHHGFQGMVNFWLRAFRIPGGDSQGARKEPKRWVDFPAF